MVEFIDKTTIQDGTPINRANLMAVQGFETKNIVFADTTITETNGENQAKTTTFNADGTITEAFTGEKTITKTITFNADGTITEVIS